MRLSTIAEAELAGLRLHHASDPVTELDGDTIHAEDLSAYYPVATQASPNGAGRPAAPASVTPPARGAAAMVGAPAMWVIVIAAASLILLHKAG